MRGKKNDKKIKGAVGVKKRLNPHAIYAPAPKPGVHGFYIDPVKVDGRTRVALLRKNLRNVLLERFSSPVPAAAQILADRASVKILRIAAFEAFILAGNSPSEGTNRNYLALCESVRRDLAMLWQMARDGVGEKVPDLREYLEILRRAEKAQVIRVEGNSDA
jgi:hypothetical protein